MFHNKTQGEKKKYFLDVEAILWKTDRHWRTVRERHRTGLMAFHLNSGFPSPGPSGGELRGCPLESTFVPSNEAGPPAFPADSAPLLPSAPFPWGSERGWATPALPQPALPGQEERQVLHSRSSQTGLRGQLLEKGKGGFSRAKGGESPAVTKERDVLPLRVER